jgi:hypothetical protein
MDNFLGFHTKGGKSPTFFPGDASAFWVLMEKVSIFANKTMVLFQHLAAMIGEIFEHNQWGS